MRTASPGNAKEALEPEAFAAMLVVMQWARSGPAVGPKLILATPDPLASIMFQTCSRAVAALLALLLYSAISSAQTALYTIHWEVEVFGPNHDCTTTLYDDGTISTAVDFAPDPDASSIPSGLIPDGAEAGSTTIPDAMTEGEAEGAIAGAISGYLVGEWAKVGYDKLKSTLKRLFDWADDLWGGLSEWLDRMYGAEPVPSGGLAVSGEILDSGFNSSVARGVINNLKDWYDAN